MLAEAVAVGGMQRAKFVEADPLAFALAVQLGKGVAGRIRCDLKCLRVLRRNVCHF